MKNYLTLLFVFYFFQIHAQSTFEKIYKDANTSEQGTSTCLSSDGKYMVAGSRFGGIIDVAFLMKIDGIGNVIWRKEYPGLTGFRSITLTNDNGFAIAGNTDTLGDMDMFILKTDSSGSVQWCTMCAHPGSFDFSLYVMQDQNGEFYLAGQGSSGTNYMYIIKLDAGGNHLWDKIISASSAYIFVSHVSSTADGGFIITGSNNTNNTSGLFLMKIDNSGQTVWTKSYGSGFYGRISYQTVDGGYITSGYGSSPGIQRGFILMKSDSLGTLQWCKVYSDATYSPDLIIDANGDYVMAGTHEDGITDSANVYLIKTNTLGDTIWTRFYSIDTLGYAGETATCIHLDPDGGYFVVARADIQQTNKSDIYLLKTDVDGHAGCNEVNHQIIIESIIPPLDTNVTITSGINTTSLVITDAASQISDSTLCLLDFVIENDRQLQIELFPNPSSGFITIQTPLMQSKDFILEVNDMTGRKILQDKITPGMSESIDVSDFSKGIYLVRIIGENGAGVKYFTKQ